MSTDDILRAWFRPIRPHLRLLGLIAPGAYPLVEDVIAGRYDLVRASWILFWFTVGALDGLYQRSPRNPFPWTRKAELALATLPPEIPGPTQPPSGDLPRDP